MPKKHRLKSARLRGCEGRSNYDERLPKNAKGESCATILVSVGKPHFEVGNPKLNAFLGLLDGILDYVEVIVSDSLQRYNLEVEKNLTEDEALKKSLEYGEKWEDDCRKLITELHNRKAILHKANIVKQPLKTTKYHFKHWDDFRLDPSFSARYENIVQFSEANTEFKKALNESVKEYCQRREKDKTKKVFPAMEVKSLRNCEGFLLEECTAIVLGVKYPIFYPGKCTAVLEKMISMINSSASDAELAKSLGIENTERKSELAWHNIHFRELDVPGEDYSGFLSKIDPQSNFFDTTLLNIPKSFFIELYYRFDISKSFSNNYSPLKNGEEDYSSTSQIPSTFFYAGCSTQMATEQSQDSDMTNKSKQKAYSCSLI